MDQAELLPHEFFSKVLTIVFAGDSRELQEYEIDASLFAGSLQGYANYVKSLSRDVLGVELEVTLVASNDGSFKAGLKILGQVATCTATVFSILMFFGIDARTIGDAFTEVQSTIIQNIKESDEGVHGLIERIRHSNELSKEEKELLINSLLSSEIGESLDEFTKPLNRIGYENISIYFGKSKKVEIMKEDRRHFEYVPPAEESIEFFKDEVEIVYLSPELNRWYFKGTRSFWAEVLDNDFVRKTKDKKPNELKGQKFYAVGRRIISRERGSRRRRTDWEIDSIEEVQDQHKLK